MHPVGDFGKGKLQEEVVSVVSLFYVLPKSLFRCCSRDKRVPSWQMGSSETVLRIFFQGLAWHQSPQYLGASQTLSDLCAASRALPAAANN